MATNDRATVTKTALELQAGDVIVRQEHFPNSLYCGTVRTTVTVDAGVQINLVDGCYTRPEGERFEVAA